MSRSSRSVHVATVVATGAVLLLSAVGCGEEETPPADTTTTTTTAAAAAPSDAAVTWAGTVCSDADALRAAVGDALAATPENVDASVPEQARAEIQTRVEAVQEAGQALVTTLSSPPGDAGTELKATADSLSEPAAQAQTQLDAMRTAASSVTSATTPEDAKAAVSDLRSAALAAGTAVSTYADELRRAIGDADPPVRAAFGAAPPCQEIPGTPSS